MAKVKEDEIFKDIKEMPKSEQITEKQKRFCDEYLLSFNATDAAIKAGYSKNSAKVIGCQNLTKLNLQKYLAVRKNKIAEKFEITQDRVIQEYSRIAFTDIRSFYDENGRLKSIHELDQDTAAAFAGLEIDEIFDFGLDGKVQVGETKKIKRWDKVKALDSICKILGFNAPAKVAQTDKDGNDVPFNVTLNIS